ncbi:hypothetical protein O7626_39815 [Micromonospora sp. WMMD1102]|uniref:hypothetical protein n=1 Tax=Micromonospora sp. WMMD1102 TaxID=3016105 RepID=UPI002415652C|nr:hypothetical protein [Micromonospora sp. WMMD1102]MDG4791963.1 hypothetical protein [Micromonospora sp. WMMD1102]
MTADLSPVETLRAAADRVWTAPNPHPWAAVDPDAARALAGWFEAVAVQYDDETEVDDTLECAGCGYDGGCGGHTDTVHEVCGQIVSACTCIKPALAVARNLLGVPNG